MKIDAHYIEKEKVAEIISENVILKTPQDGVLLLNDLQHKKFCRVIIHAANIVDEFFDPHSDLATQILQQFSDRQIKVVIVGNYFCTNTHDIQSIIDRLECNHQVSYVENRSLAFSQRFLNPLLAI